MTDQTDGTAARRWLMLALLAPVFAACAPAAVEAPAPTAMAIEAAAVISADDIHRKVHVLAHDSMRGRDTPSPELEQAARFIQGHFEYLGLEPAAHDGTFIHRWDFERAQLVREETVVRVAGQDGPEPTYEVDYFMVPGFQPTAESPLFYMGTAGPAQPPPDGMQGAMAVFYLPVAEIGLEWQQRLMGALQPAMMGGAGGVLVVLHPDFDMDMITQLASSTAQQQAPFPVIGMAYDAARDLVAAAGGDLDSLREADTPGPIGDRTLEVRTRRTVETARPPNVVAMRRGSDPALRDSYIVITAHFDHVGVGNPDETGDSIFNGADDNASGTSALMAVARAFAALPEAPRRSVVFLAVSGEEHGLLGSMAWTEDPTVPLDGVVANINLDMVGRNHPDTVIGIGQEYTTLEGLIQEIAAERPGIGLTVILDPVPEEMYFFRSDQLSFIREGIPAVFFTTGDHDDYHRQSDTPEKIDFDKVSRIARLAFHLAFEIAMDPQAPEWTEEGWREVQQMIGN